MKKSIHIIVKYFYPVAAGIEANILETYSVLVKNGWDITIHTSKDTLTEKNILPVFETIRGLKVVRYPFAQFSYWPQINWDKAGIVCLHNFNVAPHFFIMLYALYRKLLGKTGVVFTLTPHGGFNPDWSIFPAAVAWVKQLYHFTIGTLLINLTIDGVRAVSVWEKREIIKKGVLPEKVTTISNGMENEAYVDVDKRATAEIKAKVKEFGRYIIQIGRIYSIKNNETTIKSLLNIPKDIKLILAGPVGDEQYKKSLIKLIEKHKLTNRVIFLGVIRGVDKYYLIKHAQMMVHMAHWESFCNVVHEAMSQGLVCIVANNTALPLLIKDGVNGYCVETTNYLEVSKKINYVLDPKNRKEMKKISKTNRVFGLKESWSSVARTMENWFTSKLI